MATSALDFILRTRKQGDAEKEVATGLDKLKSGVGQLGVVFAGMSAAAIAAGVAAKQAFEFGKRGAVVSQTEDSFNRLLISLGANVDLLDELRMASAGTVDDMTLMSSTATLLAGATGQLGQDLANATPELLEIAKAANKLNPTLGDTAFLYESISTGIKRNSPLILDNLGLTIKIGAANEEYAKALGKTVEELTADEQKQALLNEVLRAGNVLIEQAGGAAGGAADAYAELDAALKNYSDRMAAQYAPAITTVVDALNDTIDRGEEKVIMLEALDRALSAGYISEKEYREALRETEHGYGSVNETVQWAIQVMDAYDDRIQGLIDKAPEFEDGHTRAASAAAALDGAVYGATEALENEKDALDSVNEVMKSYTTELLFNKAAQDLDAESALALARSLGLVDERTAFMLEEVDDLRVFFDLNKNGFIDAGMEADAYNTAIKQLDESLKSLPSNIPINVNVGITGPGASLVGTPGANIGNTIQAYADGGSFVTSGPQMILVGEAGPEQVTVQPLTNNNYNLTVNEAGGVVDPALSFAFMRSMARST